MSVRVSQNRAQRKYSIQIQVARCLWGLIGFPLFRITPRPLFSVRRALLRGFGAKVGANVHIYPTVRIYFPWNLEIDDFSAIGDRVFLYNLGELRIGKRVTISHGAHLCGGTHDHRLATFPLVKAQIQVEDDAWVCADAFVGPGVTIHEGTVVGARSVVVRDLPAWKIVAGNPARVLGQREIHEELSA